MSTYSDIAKIAMWLCKVGKMILKIIPCILNASILTTLLECLYVITILSTVVKGYFDSLK
jgi:hypothetical protein